MSVVEQERVVETAPTPQVTTRDVLHRAADLLEEFGWCQGQMYDGGRFCFAGAVHQAWRDYGLPPKVDALGLDADDWVSVLGISWGHFVGWNDTPGRTKAEVVARLRDAANSA